MSTNPFRIPIGTSDPVDICKGLPLYPGLGTARAGVAGAARSIKLIDVSATVLITRLKISSYCSWGVGVCGPAIGFLSPNVDVLRENIDDQGRLTLTFNDGLEMEAGLFVGASLGFGLNLAFQVYLPTDWYKPWTFAWRDAFSIDVNYTIDFLALLFDLIQFLLSKYSKSSFMPDNQNRLRDTLPDLKKTFGMVDGTGSGSKIEPDLSVSPKLTLPFNLINYIPGFKSINEGLSKVCGEISAGPSFHLQFPVTFNFDKFSVVDGATSADYEVVKYEGNQVLADGKQFNTLAKPSRVTSHVKYATGFAVGVSVHFKVALAKFFSFEKNSPSLDLTYFLTHKEESDLTQEVLNSVSTCVEGNLVLTPNMTLTITGLNGRRSNFVTGEKLKGTITLPGYPSSKSATVKVTIEPQVDNFPITLTIPNGSQPAFFNFEFKNQCLATGNRNDPSQTAPPSALTPLQTYTMRASLESGSNGPCSDYEVEMSLKIEERFLRCQRDPSHTPPGPAPAWDRLAGGTINADPSLPGGPSKTYVAALSLWFPSLDNKRSENVPVTLTLLDENRQPHTGSNVVVKTNEGFLPLNPSATGTVTLATEREANPLFGLLWYSKGPQTGYSNRFFLIVDAGCQYGQTEFWLDVWNWS